MKTEIIIGIALLGPNKEILLSDVKENISAVLKQDYAKIINKKGQKKVILTDKGRKTYNALLAVVAITTIY